MLLYPRGFDQRKREFDYSVSPNFGARVAGVGSASSPFRLIIDVQIDIGENRETQAIESFMAPALGVGEAPSVEAIKQRLVNAASGLSGLGMRILLRWGDSLDLSQSERDSLTALERSFQIVRDSIYGSLAGSLAAAGGRYDSRQLRALWHESIGQSVRAAARIGSAANSILTPPQIAWLGKRGIDPWRNYAPAWVERQLRAPMTHPQ